MRTSQACHTQPLPPSPRAFLIQLTRKSTLLIKPTERLSCHRGDYHKPGLSPRLTSHRIAMIFAFDFSARATGCARVDADRSASCGARGKLACSKRLVRPGDDPSARLSRRTQVCRLRSIPSAGLCGSCGWSVDTVARETVRTTRVMHPFARTPDTIKASPTREIAVHARGDVTDAYCHWCFYHTTYALAQSCVFP